MQLEELRLYNFRNLADGNVRLSPGVNFLVGPNGHGKTNVLEAIYFLSTSRSFRTSKPRELIRWGKNEASVYGKIRRESWAGELGISLEKKHRRAFVNGEETKSLVDFLGRFLSVSFAPSDLEIIKGGPAHRRKFVDRYLCSLTPKIFSLLVRYRRLLKNKNVLLKETSSVTDTLQTWNEMLAELSLEIYTARRNFLRELEQAAQQIQHTLAPHDNRIQLRLKSNIFPQLPEEEPTLGSIKDTYEQAIVRELQQQNSIIGIHRDDIEISLGEISARAFASQGQTRTAILSLVLGVTDLLKQKTGEVPVLLLDDVESELDPDRTRKLFEMAFSMSCQVFVSGTDPKFFQELCSGHEQQLLKTSDGHLTI